MKRQLHRIMHPQRNIKLKGFQILLFIVFLFLTKYGLGQTTLHTVDFETDGSGYTISPSESNANTSNPDYWIRTNGITPAIFPTNGFTTSNGDYFFAIEDLDYDDGATKHIITCDAVTVSGYSNLQIKLLIGGTTGTQTIEPTKFLKIEYNMDGGGWVTRAQFIGDDTNYRYYEDENADGTIDGPALLSALSEFTYSIPITGSSLQVRFYFYCGGSEELAIDDIRVLGVSANAAPTATAPSAPSVTEDDTNVALANDIDVADSDGDDQTLTFTITGGTLTTGTTGITFGGGGNGTSSFTAAGTLANINAALDAATFTPTPNLSGTNVATISFTTNDGTDTSSAASVNFTIVAVNDNPTGSDFTASTIYEGTPYTFATSDFGYSDVDGDAMVKIGVNSVPANGILYVDADNGDDYDSGEELSDGASVSKTDLDNGNLQYINNNGTSSSFQFAVYDGTAYSASAYVATLTVTGEPTVTLSLDPTNTIAETSGSTNVKATLSHSFNKDVTVNLALSGTATGAGTDYTLAASLISVTVGNTSNSVLLSSNTDVLDENDETVIIDISSVTNGTENGIQQETVTINDDDATPTVAFNATSSNGSEALASANLQVDLSAASGLTVTVDYAVTGTATGADYTLADGTLTLTAGDANDNITIGSIVNDLLDENNETVIVTLSNPTNASLGTNTVHTYTINDNDATPTVAFNATSSNGSEALASANLQVDLSAASGRTVTVDYAVTGTATSADYTLADGTLTLTAGDVNDNITIASIVNDLLDENNETVIVTLSNPVNATLGTNTVHTYTINDNDATPTIAFNATSSNGSEALASANLQVDLSAASGLTVTVDYTVAGTATSADYTLADGTLTLTAGDANDNITIGSIVNDLLDENNETVIVTLSNPTNASLGTNTVHTYTINDNDATPTVAFNTTSSNGSESLASANLQVDLSAASGRTVTVDYAVTGTASGSGTDYGLADGTLTLTAGVANDNITIGSIVNDLLDENNETVIVTLSNPVNATLGTNTVHTYTINDNDATPTIAFNATSSNGSEALASANLQVDLSAASGLTVTVDYTVAGTATSADYTLADGTLTLTAGDANDNITIGSIVNDLLDENNETVIVTLSNPTNASLGTNTVHTYTINDNDATPTIAFNTTSSNGSESLASANLQVDLSAASGLTVTVDYAVTGTASGSGTDYSLADGTLTLTAGDVNDNITIASIVNDLLDENNETVIVTLSNPVNATLGINTVHTYTINDDDALPEITFEQAFLHSIDESGIVNMNIVMLPVSGRDVTIPFTVNASSTATAGVDYTISSSPVVIPAGSENVNIVVNIVSDAFDEDNETLVVDMGAVDYATPQFNTSQTVTLVDDDDTPTIAFNATSSNGTEALASANLQVDLSAASGLTVTVDYTVAGTATSADYTLADGTLTLTAGDANDNITIGSIVNDLLDENNETVIVTLSNPVNATLGTNMVHTYTINDNDATPTIAFNATSSNGSEALASANLQVDLSAASGRTVTVDYAVTGTATGADYTLADGTLTLTAGDANDNITIGSIVNDLLDENNETVIVTLSNPTNASLGTNTVHTYTINDNDATPTVAFNATSSNGSEALASANLQVDLSAASGLTVTVDYAVTGTASGSGTDYSLADGTLTLTAGNMNDNITIGSIVNDLLDENNETVIVTLSSPTNATLGINRVHTYTINDNDATPVITVNQSYSINEDAVNAEIVATVLATDADAGTTFTNWTITGGNSDGIFEINSTSGEITVADNSNLDFETTTSYTLLVTVSDGTNISSVEEITINIADVNDINPVITASQSFTIDETAVNGASVGTVLATDADTGTAFTNWTITGGNSDGIFEINSGSGEITVADNTNLDYETTTSYTLSIAVSDGVNTSVAEDVTISVNPINDNIPVIRASQSFDVNENAANTTSVGTVLATDADAGTTFTNWTITSGNGDGIFGIDEFSGEIKIVDNTHLDAENKTSYLLQIRVSDGDHISAIEDVTVNVIDINDNAPIIETNQVMHIEENKPQNTLVGTIQVSDIDVTPTSSYVFSWVEGNLNSAFVLDPISGEIRVNNPGTIDCEKNPRFELVFTVSDGVNISEEETITVILDDVNEFPPIVNSITFSVDENVGSSVRVGKVLASDGDATNIFSNWTIVAGNEDDVFAINPSSGEITIADNTNLDFEITTSYTLSVTVSDGVSTSSAETIRVNVNDINDEAPVVTASQSFTIDETVVNDASVGTVLVSDGDAGTTYSSWTITGGNDDSIFTINSTNGEITIADNTNLDFEATTSYSLSVTVSDGVNTSSVETIRVNVNDINDEAPVVTASQSFAIDETAVNGANVGTVLVSDGDAGTTYSSWAITSGNDDGIFTINSMSGEITIADNSNLDFESKDLYSLEVRVSDGIHISEGVYVGIQIKDVNERPVANAGEDQLVPESSMVKLDGLSCNDPDGDMLNYVWTSPEGIVLSDVNSSEPKFEAPSVEVLTNYVFTLIVNDGELYSEEASVTVSVDNVVGIEDIDSEEIAVSTYPNPSSGAFYLELNKRPEEGAIVSLFSLSGKLAYREKIYEKKNYFNLSLGASIYLLKVELDGNIITKKIVIR